jgi:hypothetical protein
MNEHKAADLLDRLANDVRVGPPPVEGLLASGQRRLRWWRVGQVGGTALVAMVVAIAIGVVFRPDTTVQPTQAPDVTHHDKEGDPTDSAVVKVPAVVGLLVPEARQALRSLGLSVEVRPTACARYDECVQDRVTSMDPPPGQTVSVGSTVRITSDGGVLDTIEGLTGKDVGLALGLNSQVTLDVHDCFYYAQYEQGSGFCLDEVQAPVHDKRIIAGQIVGFLPAEVPSVVGLDQHEATQTLNDLGLHLNIKVVEDTEACQMDDCTSASAGQIVAQEPDAGPVGWNSVVTLFVVPADG